MHRPKLIKVIICVSIIVVVVIAVFYGSRIDSRRITWSEESFTRYSKPQHILNQGKGRCEEFAIVYVAACLALDYEARIVVSKQFYLILVRGFHTWAEVKVNSIWVQVDPSPTAFWNDTSRYRSWD